jgi:hypothetical protein
MNTDEHGYFRAAAIVAIAMTGAMPALAQNYDDPPEYRERSDYRDAYRKGYERGFERGYAKGMDDGMRRAPPPPVVAPAPAVPRLGPIRVTGAYYGTSSKNCNAGKYVGSRANGKRSYSFEVSNSICGDPVPGQRKSLEVTYYCGEIMKTASANEHRTIYLDCGS